MNLMRVSEMVHLTRYEEGKGGAALKICKYYKGDYVALQMIKSFFLTTIAFFLILALAAAGNINWFLEHFDQMNLAVVGAILLISYIVLMATYLAVTFVTANIRYGKARRSVRAYEIRLKELGDNVRYASPDAAYGKRSGR
jgi:hypothetical protein